MKKRSAETVLAYVPVLHEGYRRFFEKHRGAGRLMLIGPQIIKDFKPLAKDLRALDPTLMKAAVYSLGIFKSVMIVAISDLESLNKADLKVIMPDEDVMHELRERYFPSADSLFDPFFLRWDKHKSFEGKPIKADQIISKDTFDKKTMAELKKESRKSADFWRQIGAAIVKEGQIIMKAHNKAVPLETMNYIEGDPRSDFSKGVNVELSLFFHCEAQLIAEAAREGISLKGTSIYVSTFPCPPCAKLIAYSGIKKLYYADGYGVLDGEQVLKSQGVEIIFVDMSK